MPNVGGKKYPYTPKGIAAAKKAAKKDDKVKPTMGDASKVLPKSKAKPAKMPKYVTPAQKAGKKATMGKSKKGK